MKLIVAAAADWGIGKNGGLLVNNKEDMRFFRNTTSGNVVVMGRKTLESFPAGRPLKNRDNIVITNDTAFSREGVFVVHSIEEAAALAKERAGADKEIFVIGGESIYRQMLCLVDTALVTRMNKSYDADTYFPNLDESDEWELEKYGEEMEYEDGTFRFCTYIKKK